MRRLIILIALLGLASVPVPSTWAAFPGNSGRIAYVDQGLDSVPVIASMAADGSDVTQLTTSAESPHGDVDPAWSPGGAYIVFTRLNAAGLGNIWRMNADGSGQRRITGFAADDGYPGFSADGARIVFASRFDDFANPPADWEIWSVNVLGGDLRRLTSNTAADLDPAWSPDNTRIIFTSDRRGAFEIHTMNTDGSSVARQTSGLAADADDIAPDWDPAGGKATFTRIDSAGDADVMLLNVDVPSSVYFLSDADYDAWSAYAPAQGFILGQLAFQTDALGDDDIALVDKSGGPVDIITADHDGHQTQPDWQPQPSFPLVDARFSTFHLDIVWLFAEAITVGCSPERFCPDANVTRAEMASFLVRALDLPATTSDYFDDDETSMHEANINALRDADITFGCGPTTYCPLARLTRGEMASFLVRAFNLPPSPTDHFTDDDGTTHEQSINRIADAGITTGCSATEFCPLHSVTRGQMAAFLHRAME